MARPKRRRVDLNGHAGPLASITDPTWKDPRAVASFLASIGIATSEKDLAGIDWPARFTYASRAYCAHHGLMSEKWPKHIDAAKAREAGIDISGTSRYRIASRRA